jgi:hypothetical protein
MPLIRSFFYFVFEKTNSTRRIICRHSADRQVFGGFSPPITVFLIWLVLTPSLFKLEATASTRASATAKFNDRLPLSLARPINLTDKPLSSFNRLAARWILSFSLGLSALEPCEKKMLFFHRLRQMDSVRPDWVFR